VFSWAPIRSMAKQCQRLRGAATKRGLGAIVGKNAFSDLGFSKAESAAHQARVSLAVQIERYIDLHGLTQTKAAAVFRVPQPTISKIVRGDLSRLSVEYLIRMLARVGIAVNIMAVAPIPRRRRVAA
jgi:predicted XRE-type DNA-binding protein